KKANEQAEHFEREWYLRGDEIEKLSAAQVPQSVEEFIGDLGDFLAAGKEDNNDPICDYPSCNCPFDKLDKCLKGLI
ncbi:MAG: hypothetical protein WC322_05925, partial [Candidatus Paceibacterota bacterium]